MTLSWNDFERLLDAAAGNSPQPGKIEKRQAKSYLIQVARKREALEKQQTIFSQANEDTIVEEYRKLRRAHRDFLSTFQQARSAFVVNPSPQKQNN